MQKKYTTKTDAVLGTLEIFCQARISFLDFITMVFPLPVPALISIRRGADIWLKSRRSSSLIKMCSDHRN